jgi:hypothetical protein
VIAVWTLPLTYAIGFHIIDADLSAPLAFLSRSSILLSNAVSLTLTSCLFEEVFPNRPTIEVYTTIRAMSMFTHNQSKSLTPRPPSETSRTTISAITSPKQAAATSNTNAQYDGGQRTQS